MTIENKFVGAPPDANDLQDFLTQARTELKNSKDSAMKAAAHAYLVWYFCESDFAEGDAKRWLEAEIQKRNNEIDNANAALDALKGRVKAQKAGKLNEELPAEMLKEIGEHHDLDATAWSKRVKGKVEARSDANSFTRIVKFVFGFDHPDDASHVSRYATVLRYISDHQVELGGLNVEAIVKLLKGAGGFEAVVNKQRGTSKPKPDAKKRLDRLKDALSKAAVVTQLSHSAKYDRGGIVFLVGRKQGTNVDLLGEVALTEFEADHLLTKIDTDVIGDRDDCVELIAQIFDLGEIVREGKETEITEDGTKAGKKLKEQRVVTVGADDTGAYFLVSARYANASAVIKVRPVDGLDIGSVSPGHYLMLEHLDGRNIANRVEDPMDRLFLEFNVDARDPLVWSIQDTASETEAAMQYSWLDLIGQAHWPLSVRTYEPVYRVQMTAQNVAELYDAYLKNWADYSKQPQAVRKPLKVSANGPTFGIGHEAFGAHSVDGQRDNGGLVELNFRPGDLVDLFDKLRRQNAPMFEFQADADGLLSVSWTDHLGKYEVYLPSVDKRGQLETRCVGYLKPTVK